FVGAGVVDRWTESQRAAAVMGDRCVACHGRDRCSARGRLRLHIALLRASRTAAVHIAVSVGTVAALVSGRGFHRQIAVGAAVRGWQLHVTVAAAARRRIAGAVADTRFAGSAVDRQLPADVETAATTDFAAAVSAGARRRARSTVRRSAIADHFVVAAAGAVDPGGAAFPRRAVLSAAAVLRGLSSGRGCRLRRLLTSGFCDRLLAQQPPRQQEAENEGHDYGGEPTI